MKNFMLSGVEHEIFFITLGPEKLAYILLTPLLCINLGTPHHRPDWGAW